MREITRRNQVRIYEIEPREIETLIREYVESKSGVIVKILLEREQIDLGERVTVLVD